MIHEMDTDGDGTIDLEEFQTMILQTLRGFGQGDATEQEELKEYESRYMRQLEIQRDRVKAKIVKRGFADELEEKLPSLEQMAMKRHHQSFPFAQDKRVDTAPILELGPRPGPVDAVPGSSGNPRPRVGSGTGGVRSPMAANLMQEARQRLSRLETRYQVNDDASEAVLGEARSIGFGSSTPRDHATVDGADYLIANGIDGTPRSQGSVRGYEPPEGVPQASGLGANEEQRLHQLLAEAERRRRGVPLGSDAGDANAVSSQDGLRMARLQAELQRR